MGADRDSDPKVIALRQRRSLNPRPDRVTDAKFSQDEFFDPRDLVQVKYEMLRAVREGRSVTGACADFGFSRPSFYETQKSFEREGLPGLVSSKPGPRGPHKLSDEVLDYAEEVVQRDVVSNQELATRIEQRFGVKAHPRSIERALKQRKKKRLSE